MVSFLASSLYLSTLLSLSVTETPYTYDMTSEPEPDELPYVPKYPSARPVTIPLPPAAADDGLNMTKYAYDKAARLAREVTALVHSPTEEFLATHMYYLLESPAALAIKEYSDKVDYAKRSGAEDCLANGEEKASKDFRKRLAEVVYACESGWKRNSTVVEKAQALLRNISDLDRQANEALKGCKKGQFCYYQFTQSSEASAIDKQLSEMRRSQLVDLRVVAAQDHVTSKYSLYKCNADHSANLRKDVYTASAKLTVCISSAGLIVNF